MEVADEGWDSGDELGKLIPSVTSHRTKKIANLQVLSLVQVSLGAAEGVISEVILFVSMAVRTARLCSRFVCVRGGRRSQQDRCRTRKRDRFAVQVANRGRGLSHREG